MRSLFILNSTFVRQNEFIQLIRISVFNFCLCLRLCVVPELISQTLLAQRNFPAFLKRNDRLFLMWTAKKSDWHVNSNRKYYVSKSGQSTCKTHYTWLMKMDEIQEKKDCIRATWTIRVAVTFTFEQSRRNREWSLLLKKTPAVIYRQQQPS